MAPQEPPPRRAVGDRDAGSNHSDRGNSEGSGHNADRSPAHPSYANRVGARESNRGSASPAWDRNKRQSSGDEGSVFAPGTPKNNSRLRQGVPRQQEEPVRKNFMCMLKDIVLLVPSNVYFRSHYEAPCPKSTVFGVRSSGFKSFLTDPAESQTGCSTCGLR